MAKVKHQDTHLHIKLSIKLMTAIKVGARDMGVSVSEYIRYLATEAQSDPEAPK
jgi:predicted DNA binding CopG/RHH family protein